jgi:DNA-directed RNA polymerase subunit M/transcription elongation factor TFIIS
MPSVLITTLLTARGEVRRAQVKLTDDGLLTKELAQAYFRKKTEPEILDKFKHGDSTIYVLGYKEGKSGTENKCPMPPTETPIVAFGDILLIVSEMPPQNMTWNSPTIFLPATWELFLQSATKSKADQTFVVGETEDSESEAEEELGEIASVAEEEGIESESEDSILGSEVEEEEAPPPVRRKKKATPSQILSGYQQQNVLLMTEAHNELKADGPQDALLRKECIDRFTFLKEHGIATDQLEKEIFCASLEEAAKKHIFAHWNNKLFTEIYSQRQRRIFSNLHPASPVGNTTLLPMVKSGSIGLAEVARYTDIDLFPDNWTKLKELQLIREHKWLEGNVAAKTDQFKCSKCGKRECSYYEMQTRSADEPMTIFITCLNCNKKWRQ